MHDIEYYQNKKKKVMHDIEVAYIGALIFITVV